ncbi:MAG: hypothetical protein FWE23_08035 [Chitinivibrionia bacterium]|nr:hypothetical protein [Chitinivibrionia bacterium]
MQLPKTPRGQKFKEKICMYPGCGKVFYGIHISKYCVEHRKDRYRIRKRTKPEDVNLKNQTIQHKYTTVVEQTMNCALIQCTNQFTTKIFPRQYIYPKFCPEHRNEYKRERHLRQIGREDLIEAMKADSGMFSILPTEEEKIIDENDDAVGTNDEIQEEFIEEEEIAIIPEDFVPLEEFDESMLNDEDDVI